MNMTDKDKVALAGTAVVLAICLMLFSVFIVYRSTGKDSREMGRDITIYTDQAGCDYIIINGAAITPRMGRDGKQVCQ